MTDVVHLTSTPTPQVGPSESVEPSPILLFTGQVRDPIYGYVDYIKELEGVVMDSWVLQRLRYIFQLQAAHFVYPGATHTRFSHSVGVMFSSYKYMSFLLRSTLSARIEGEVAREARSRQRELIIATRLLGLLHDIGHGPFSHAFDRYVYKTKRFLDFKVGNHEVVTYILYRDYLKGVIERLALESRKSLGVDPEYLLEVVDAGIKPPRGMIEHTDLVVKGVLSKSEFYEDVEGPQRVVRLVVRDYIYTSDIMDYLKRDSFYTGVPVGQINDDWIVRNSFIVYRGGKPTIAVASKALDEVARLFDARMIMYKYVYLHPVNVAFVETIGRLLECIKSAIVSRLEKVFTPGGRVEEYASLTDFSIYSKLQELLLKSPSEYECEDKSFARAALESLFYNRKPVWKLIKRFTYSLEEAKVFYGGIGPEAQRAVIEKVKREIASRYSSKNISEDDVEIIFDKIDVFPTASEELVKGIEVVDVKAGEIIDQRFLTYEEFAKEYGLRSEALISLYINREKYKNLTGKDLENIVDTTRNIIESTFKYRRREAPETS
jgi:HD superfamily phosphohydrolase